MESSALVNLQQELETNENAPRVSDPQVEFIIQKLNTIAAEDAAKETPKELVKSLMDNILEGRSSWISELSLILSSIHFDVNIRYFMHLNEPAHNPLGFAFPFAHSYQSFDHSYDSLNGLLIPNTPAMSNFYPSKEKEAAGWNWEEKNQKRAIIIRTHNHYEYAMAAPDLMQAFNHPHLPPRWKPSVLFPLTDHAANNTFLAPFFAYKQVNFDPAYFRPFDVIKYKKRRSSHSSHGILLAITVKTKLASATKKILEDLRKHLHSMSPTFDQEAFHLKGSSSEDAFAAFNDLSKSHFPQFEFFILPLHYVETSFNFDTENVIVKEKEAFRARRSADPIIHEEYFVPNVVRGSPSTFGKVLETTSYFNSLELVDGEGLSSLFQQNEKFKEEVKFRNHVKARLESIQEVVDQLLAHYLRERIEIDIVESRTANTSQCVTAAKLFSEKKLIPNDANAVQMMDSMNNSSYFTDMTGAIAKESGLAIPTTRELLHGNSVSNQYAAPYVLDARLTSPHIHISNDKQTQQLLSAICRH
jgi:hypothetical protein